MNNITFFISIASFVISVGSSFFVVLDRVRKPQIDIYWTHKELNTLYFKIGIYNSASLPCSITNIKVISLTSKKEIYLPALKQLIVKNNKNERIYSDIVPLNVDAKVSATGIFVFPNIEEITDFYDSSVLIILDSGNKQYRVKQRLKSKEISSEQLADI